MTTPLGFSIQVRDVMVDQPVLVRPEETILTVLNLMNTHRIGAVMVCVAQRLQGIFTERDLLRQAAASGPEWRNTPVRDWMTPDPYVIPPDASWDEAMRMMEHLRVRHLPVIEHGQVIGIVSSRQLIARREEHLNHQIEQRTRELREANESLLARDAEITAYMRAAARLQTKLLLPHAPPDWTGIDFAIHYAPLDHLGGDYYDFAQPDDDHLGILIADASGHGIPAALVAVMTRIVFREVAQTTTDPSAVLVAMNERLQGLSDERFVTAFYGVLERSTYRFCYANAGHHFPLRYSRQQPQCEPLAARGFMLGIMPDEAFHQRTIQLQPGDRLCLYTDGVSDSCNEHGEIFGTQRLTQLLQCQGAERTDVILCELVSSLQTYRGTRAHTDDVTALIVGIED